MSISTRFPSRPLSPARSTARNPSSSAVALTAFRRAISDKKLTQNDFDRFIKPHAALLARPGTYQDTVRAIVNGTSDEHVEMSAALKSRLTKLMTPSAVDARRAFEAAIADGKLTANDVRDALEPFVGLLRVEGPYRDAVSGLVQGRTDRYVELSPPARAFFVREGILNS